MNPCGWKRRRSGLFVPANERTWRRPSTRQLLLALTLAAAWPSGGASLLLFLCYPAQIVRVYRRVRRRGVGSLPSAAYALSCIVSKFAEVAGAWRFKMKELRSTPLQLIEHR